MLRVLLIEDEAPAARRLAALVRAATPACTVVGTADSVAAARRWFAAHPAPDLVLADIELGDGRSLDLFRATRPPCPVIFTTAHDDHLLEAFALHGIAYLLKPVTPAALAAALEKYRALGAQFARSLPAPAAAPAAPARRSRLLAQRGREFHPVALAEVAYFHSADKLTFLVTHAGERRLVNEALADLAAEFTPGDFFRLNRNYLAHAAAVKRFSTLGKGRLLVQLAPRTAEEVVVSQENGAAFRTWAGG